MPAFCWTGVAAYCVIYVCAPAAKWMKNVFAIAGRGTDAHLIVNSSTGKLGDSTIAVTDLAANICPVGAILIKEQGYQVPIGQRIYDQHTIHETALQEKITKEHHEK